MSLNLALTDWSDLQEAFCAYGRSDQFTSDGFEALYDFLDELDSGTPIDVIEICCAFYEDTAADVLSNYDVEDIEDLQANTWAVELDNGHHLRRVLNYSTFNWSYPCHHPA